MTNIIFKKKLAFILALFMVFSLFFCFSVSAGEAEAAYAVSSVTLVEGEYYIQNRHYPRYVQVDDNDKPGYSTSGSILEQWNFGGEAHQRCPLETDIIKSLIQKAIWQFLFRQISLAVRRLR